MGATLLQWWYICIRSVTGLCIFYMEWLSNKYKIDGDESKESKYLYAQNCMGFRQMVLHVKERGIECWDWKTFPSNHHWASYRSWINGVMIISPLQNKETIFPSLPCLNSLPLGDMAVILKVYFSNQTFQNSSLVLAVKLFSYNAQRASLIKNQHWLIAWCRHALIHYVSQCWTRFMSPYGVTSPHWLN